MSVRLLAASHYHSHGAGPLPGASLPDEVFQQQRGSSQRLRIFAFTAGSRLTPQQSLNNVARATAEAMAAALAGVQTMHVSSYNEALGVPTEAAATLALRTQQVVVFETDVADTVDPLAESYAVEELTDDLERRIWTAMDDVERRGGALECIANGSSPSSSRTPRTASPARSSPASASWSA